MDKMLVIFDLDGTLIDSHSAHLNAFRESMKENGLEIDSNLMKRVRKEFGKPVREIIKSAITNDDKLVDSILKSRKRILFNKEVYKIKTYPRVKQMLRRLKKNNIVALATSSSKEFVDLVLDNLGLRKYFDYIVTASDVKRCKPDPEIINKIVKRFNVKKKDTVFIGDTIFDYRTAKNAGVRFIGVINGDNKSKLLRVKNKIDRIGDLVL